MIARGADRPGAIVHAMWRRKRSRRLIVGALLLVVTGSNLWLARKPIATDYLDRYLAQSGVRARYRIVDLGLRRQRLTDVSIGDPATPDLVADWIEISTRLDLFGASVTKVRAGHVRLNARIVDGRLSLGAIDRLLPASTGARFEFPKIDMDLGDLRLRLVAPLGEIALRVDGRGRLDNGFAGHVRATSTTLAAGGCSVTALAVTSAIRITHGRPELRGTTRADGASCRGVRVSRPAMDFRGGLSAALDHWAGSASLAIPTLGHAQGTLDALHGTVAFDGSAAATAGRVDLRSGRFAARGASGTGLALAGAYRFAGSDLTFEGRAAAHGASLPSAILRRIAGSATMGAGTPIAPLAQRLAAASAAAARDFGLDADLGLALRGGAVSVELRRMALASASGANATFAGLAGMRHAGDRTVPRVAGALRMSGGALPTARIDLADAADGVLTGTAVVQPYTAGSARLALAPVRFAASEAGASVTTRVSLSGPIGTGAVSALDLPVAASWDGRSTVLIDPGCIAASFSRLADAGVVVGPTRLRLCPLSRALVSWDGMRLGGGARVTGAALAGTLGGSALSVAAADTTLDLATRRFAVAGLAGRIGAPDRLTRLDLATLDGNAAGATLGGRFSGGAGKIGAVPLLLSSATGVWRVRDGALHIDGALSVRDAAAAPRFTPLDAHAVTLDLAGSRLRATGALVEPSKGIAIADVAIEHDLGTATGAADLRVPGITFGPAFQPDALTPVTFGVVADVVGTIAGEGHIRWTPQGLTSDGVFRTKDIALAAAFGPVSGVSGEIHFTDLLNLETAPGQVATIAAINPGVPVTDGTVRYQLLPGARVRIEAARWPFAGGALTLDPTTLDFGQSVDRTLTFRVAHVDAAQFLQQFGFSNLDATGTFDGTLPMVFDASGGRIEQGHLSVLQGGGTLAYVGEISQKNLGFWGDFAFQALKSLRYRNLDIAMNGPLAGEMVTEVRFAGVGQGRGAKRNFILDRLQKLPLVFNVRITAPFRQLIDSAQSFYDPRRLIERNLPALIEEQRRAAALPVQPIQPPASRKSP